jgi:hypothetical protein
VHRLAVITAVVIAAFAITAGQAIGAAPLKGEFDVQFPDTIDCAALDPAWAFNDDFVDFYHIRYQLWVDANGEPLREIDHVEHHSNDVNSVTGFTLHEHNHYTVVVDYVAGTFTLSGAINIAQRKGVGEVIQNAGHKVIDLATGEPLILRGPNKFGDADFCAAIAP